MPLRLDSRYIRLFFKNDCGRAAGIMLSGNGIAIVFRGVTIGATDSDSTGYLFNNQRIRYDCR